MLKAIAVSNGYKSNLIDQIIGKGERQRISQHTNLSPIEDKRKYLVLPYNSNLCRGLQKIFKEVNIKLVFKPVNTLRRLLGSPKDKIEELKKSGIYLWTCENCLSGYVGQNKRNVLTRWKEHHKEYGKDSREKSSIADHALDEGHQCLESGLKLLKEINQPSLLNAYESLFIYKTKNGKINNIRNCINPNNGPIGQSSLFTLL